MVIFNAFKISFKILIFSLFFNFFFAIFLYFFGKNKKKIKNGLEVFLTLPIFLPPSIVGYIVIILLGRNSFLNRYLLSYFDLNFIFNIKGAILAAILVSFPIMYQNIKIAFDSIEKSYIETGLCLGLTPLQMLRHIYIPMSYKKIFCAIVLSVGRAFGEFGATILIAGNIPNRTQTLPLALYSSIESGDILTANKILIISLIFSCLLLSIYTFITQKKS